MKLGAATLDCYQKYQKTKESLRVKIAKALFIIWEAPS